MKLLAFARYEERNRVRDPGEREFACLRRVPDVVLRPQAPLRVRKTSNAAFRLVGAIPVIRISGEYWSSGSWASNRWCTISLGRDMIGTVATGARHSRSVLPPRELGRSGLSQLAQSTTRGRRAVVRWLGSRSGVLPVEQRVAAAVEEVEVADLVGVVGVADDDGE
jgi:hypothetical protein